MYTAMLISSLSDRRGLWIRENGIMKYTYDPEVARGMDSVKDIVSLDLRQLAALRAGMVFGPVPVWTPDPALQLTQCTVKGLNGAPELSVYVLMPATSMDTHRPALLWFHGGGFVLGDARDSLPLLEQIVHDTGAVAISVQYRLAPQTPFPGPLDDARATLDWLLAHAEHYRIDPARIAVGGQSAGGSLAAGLALRVRDEGGPTLAFQLLDIPVLDDRLVTTSAQEYTDTPVWNRRNAELGWKAYLGEHTNTVSTWAAPARAGNLHGLPPAFVSVNQYDPLRDEGMAYAMRLAQANIRVDLHLYPGTFHGSASLVPTASVSMRQQTDLRQALVRVFS